MFSVLYKAVRAAAKGEEYEIAREIPWYEVVVVLSITGVIVYQMLR